MKPRLAERFARHVAPNTVPIAEQVRVCGASSESLVLKFEDDDGSCFAAAIMSPTQATSLAETLLQKVAACVAANGSAN